MTSPRNRKAAPALLALLLPLLTLVACGGAYPSNNAGTNYPYLSAVTLQPLASPSIAVAGTVQVRADAAYQVSANEIDYTDVTSSATWSTSDAAVATVNAGLVTATGIGSATISASLNGKTGTTLVVAEQTATLDITPTGTGVLSLSASPDQHFQASASYSDGSVLDLTYYATWSSSVPAVLEFYDVYDPFDYLHGPGDARLLATGTATITATLDTAEVGSLDVTVVP
jgi:hypothetical protein